MEAINILQEWFDSLECDQIPRQKYFVGVCGVIGAIFLWQYRSKRQQNRERQIKINKKREQCACAFDQLRSSLTDMSINDEEITMLSLENLITQLEKNYLKPVQVLRAFQKKALKVTHSLNCVQTPITEAEVWAQAVSQSSEKGPLYGVPVSIKDHIPVKGYDTTFGGCTSTFDQPFPEDAVLIKVLKKQGAIPFVFTNVPQTLFSANCVNPVFGRTKNPYDPNRSPGGSSGGEATLIAAQGSVLGFGSDIGGSIRIPAAFCGICGLKPTVGRLSVKGLPEWYSGESAFENTVGPMARDVESLALAMKAVLVPYQWELDPTIVPFPFQDQVYESTKPLKIGFLKDNEIYSPSPVCQRGVEKAVEALQNLGHMVIPYKLPDVKTLRFLMDRGFFGDGGKTFLRLLNGDDPIPGLRMAKRILSLPRIIKQAVIGLLKLTMSNDDKDSMTPDALLGFGTVYEWWELVATTKTYRNQVIDDWRRLGMDALICPVAPCVAMPDKFTDESGLVFSYTGMINVLNFPAGVVPVTKVTKEDVERMSEYPAKGHMQKALKKGMSTGGVGLPVAVQCVGLPFQEELVLRVQKDIESFLKTV